MQSRGLTHLGLKLLEPSSGLVELARLKVGDPQEIVGLEIVVESRGRLQFFDGSVRVSFKYVNPSQESARSGVARLFGNYHLQNLLSLAHLSLTKPSVSQGHFTF